MTHVQPPLHARGDWKWLLGALVLAAAATAANGLQLGLERFYFRKGRLLVIMDVNLEA